MTIIEQDTREAFLSAMSNVANSVTVVTTDGPGGRHGATVSSFCSVSADPPQVLVCLNHSGNTANAVVENGVFCVNVLPETGKELAILFAGQTQEQDIDRFADDTWGKSDTAPPRLQGVTAFQCRVLETLNAASHFVIIGEVTEIAEGETAPLIYLNRTFCKTAPLG